MSRRSVFSLWDAQDHQMVQSLLRHGTSEVRLQSAHGWKTSLTGGICRWHDHYQPCQSADLWKKASFTTWQALQERQTIVQRGRLPVKGDTKAFQLGRKIRLLEVITMEVGNLLQIFPVLLTSGSSNKQRLQVLVQNVAGLLKATHDAVDDNVQHFKKLRPEMILHGPAVVVIYQAKGVFLRTVNV